MFKLTIAKKLILGFGLTLSLLIGVAVVGYYSNARSGHSMEEVGGMLADTAVGEGATVDMLMLRMKVKDFLIRNQAEDVAGYNTWRDDLLEAIEESRISFQNPERLKRLAEIESLFSTYDEAFSEVQDIITERNRVRHDVLDVVGKKATDAVKAAEYRMLDVDEKLAGNQVLSGLLDILEGRLYVIKFVTSSSASEYERASTELRSAYDRLSQALPEVRDGEAQTLISGAVADLETYITAFERVKTLVDKRDTLVKGTLDRIGPQIADLQLEIQHSLINDSLAAELNAEQSIQTANRTILGVSAVALLLGVAAAYLIYLGTVRPLKAVIERVGEIADGDGDLTQRVDDRRPDEIGELGSKVNAFISRTHDTIFAVRGATAAVTAVANEIRGNAEDMATNMSQQDGRVAEISHAITEMSNAVSDVAQQAAHASTTSNRAGEAAKSGGDIVSQTIQGMGTINDAVNASASSVTELGKRSEQIGEIVAVINEIAEQTNLLALNAAIEAARAGEHGRGFAVVADEVRKLADRTTEATQEIGDSIRAIQGETSDAVHRMEVGADQVNEGVDLAEKAGASLKLIVDSTGEVAGMIHAIASATEEQSATTVQITRTVDETSSAIREASGGAKQSFEAAAQLTQSAVELQNMIGRFKLAEMANHGH